MMDNTNGLRVLHFGAQDSPRIVTRTRERRAAETASQAAQGLPRGAADCLTSFAAAWLEKHARPLVARWLEDRAAKPVLLSIPSAARVLDLSEATVERLIAARELPTVRVGRCVRLRRLDLELWADGLEVQQ